MGSNDVWNVDPGDDVAATLEAIRAAVRARAGYDSASEVPPLFSRSPVAQATELARISAHFPLTDDTPIVGPALDLVRRAMRLALRWYINPIVEQQNNFNDAVVRALATLEAQQGELDRRLGASTEMKPADHP